RSSVSVPFQRRSSSACHRGGTTATGGMTRPPGRLCGRTQQMMEMKTPGIAMARGMRGWRRLWPLAALVAAATALPVTASAATAGVHDSRYQQVNLVSDIPGVAAPDSDLVNSWGVSASPGTDQAPGGALWVSDNGTDKTTLYTSGTATAVNKSGLVVTITS